MAKLVFFSELFSFFGRVPDAIGAGLIRGSVLRTAFSALLIPHACSF
ncbi:MAG: hypothetical protein V1904_00235 [Bacteroidota bacterium]